MNRDRKAREEDKSCKIEKARHATLAKRKKKGKVFFDFRLFLTNPLRIRKRKRLFISTLEVTFHFCKQKLSHKPERGGDKRNEIMKPKHRMGVGDVINNSEYRHYRH